MRQELGRVFIEFREIWTADNVLHRRIAQTTATEGGDRLHRHGQVVWVRAYNFTRLHDEVCLVDVAGRDRREAHEHRPAVDDLLRAEPGHGQRALDAGKLIAHVARDLLQHRLCRREAGAFGSAHGDFELRFIFFWQEIDARHHEERHDGQDCQDRHDDNHVPMCHGPLEHARIGAVDGSIETRLLRGMPGLA